VLFRSKNDPRIFIPAIYWKFTSPRILVMDEIRGTKVTELNERPPDDLDRRELAAAAVEVKASAAVLAAASDSYSATVAVWRYYKVQVQDTAAPAHGEATVVGLAKG